MIDEDVEIPTFRRADGTYLYSIVSHDGAIQIEYQLYESVIEDKFDVFYTDTRAPSEQISPEDLNVFDHTYGFLTGPHPRDFQVTKLTPEEFFQQTGLDLRFEASALPFDLPDTLDEGDLEIASTWAPALEQLGSEEDEAREVFGKALTQVVQLIAATEPQAAGTMIFVEERRGPKLENEVPYLDLRSDLGKLRKQLIAVIRGEVDVHGLRETLELVQQLHDRLSVDSRGVMAQTIEELEKMTADFIIPWPGRKERWAEELLTIPINKQQMVYCLGESSPYSAVVLTLDDFETVDGFLSAIYTYYGDEEGKTIEEEAHNEYKEAMRFSLAATGKDKQEGLTYHAVDVALRVLIESAYEKTLGQLLNRSDVEFPMEQFAHRRVVTTLAKRAGLLGPDTTNEKYSYQIPLTDIRVRLQFSKWLGELQISFSAEAFSSPWVEKTILPLLSHPAIQYHHSNPLELLQKPPL